RSARCLDELALAPLSREETAALVAQVASDVDARAVYEQSAGHPLFTIELARAGATLADRLPPSITQLVRERTDSLASEPRELLRWASVLGATFSLWLAELLSGLAPEQFLDALEQLERLGWVS